MVRERISREVLPKTRKEMSRVCKEWKERVTEKGRDDEDVTRICQRG